MSRAARPGAARCSCMHSKPNQPTRPPVKPGRPSSCGTECSAAQALDFGERIGDLARSRPVRRARVTYSVWPRERVHAPRRQADDRVAAEALAALDRFEQVGVRAVGELQVDRQRRVEVGQHLAHHRDAGVAVSGVLLELLGVIKTTCHFRDAGGAGADDGNRPPSPPTASGRKGMRGRQTRTPGDCTAAGGCQAEPWRSGALRQRRATAAGNPAAGACATRAGTQSMRKWRACTGSPSRLRVSGCRPRFPPTAAARAIGDPVQRAACLPLGDAGCRWWRRPRRSSSGTMVTSSRPSSISASGHSACPPPAWRPLPMPSAMKPPSHAKPGARRTRAWIGSIRPSRDDAGDQIGQAAEHLLQAFVGFDRDLGAEAAAGQVGAPVQRFAVGIDAQQVDRACRRVRDQRPAPPAAHRESPAAVAKSLAVPSGTSPSDGSASAGSLRDAPASRPLR